MAKPFQRMLQFLVGRGQLEADLESEFRNHWEQEVEQNLRAGMPLEEAELAARRLIGPTSLYKEQCRDAQRSRLLENWYATCTMPGAACGRTRPSLFSPCWLWRWE